MGKTDGAHLAGGHGHSGKPCDRSLRQQTCGHHPAKQSPSWSSTPRKCRRVLTHNLDTRVSSGVDLSHPKPENGPSVLSGDVAHAQRRSRPSGPHLGGLQGTCSRKRKCPKGVRAGGFVCLFSILEMTKLLEKGRECFCDQELRGGRETSRCVCEGPREGQSPRRRDPVCVSTAMLSASWESFCPAVWQDVTFWGNLCGCPSAMITSRRV